MRLIEENGKLIIDGEGDVVPVKLQNKQTDIYSFFLGKENVPRELRNFNFKILDLDEDED